MFTCVICRFPVDLDDVALPGRNGRCICLRCYARETGTAHPMPKPLQREIITTLALSGT